MTFRIETFYPFTKVNQVRDSDEELLAQREECAPKEDQTTEKCGED